MTTPAARPFLPAGFCLTRLRGAGRLAARAIFEHDEGWPPSPSDLRNSRAVQKLEIRLSRVAEFLALKIRVSRTKDLFGEFAADTASVVAEAPDKTQQRFVLAHELGHAVLHHLVTNDGVSEEIRAEFLHEGSRELFCNEFASEITLPQELVQQICYSDLNDFLSSGEAMLVRSIAADSGPRLTFYHIASLARRCGAPIVVVVGALRGHSILSESQAGIAIFRTAPNAYTLAEPGLRSWINACPTWGYIPPNQRVVRIGFLSAQRVLASTKHGETELRRELLSVGVRVIGGKNKWSSAKLECNCAYTPIHIRDGRRFLFAAWTWPSPH